MAKSIALSNPTKITADVALSAIPGRLIAVQLNGGTDASSMLFYNAASATGTELYSIVAPCVTANNSEANSTYVELPGDGIAFDSKCFVDWTGTAAVGWVWFK